MWRDLQADILEEFGRCQNSGEENAWLAQATAMREYRQQQRWEDREFDRGRPPRAPAPQIANRCADCSKQALDGKRRCADHLITDLKRARRRRASKVQRTECADCLMPALTGRRRCADHLQSQAELRRAERR